MTVEHDGKQWWHREPPFRTRRRGDGTVVVKLNDRQTLVGIVATIVFPAMMYGFSFMADDTLVHIGLGVVAALGGWWGLKKAVNRTTLTVGPAETTLSRGLLTRGRVRLGPLERLDGVYDRDQFRHAVRASGHNLTALNDKVMVRHTVQSPMLRLEDQHGEEAYVLIGHQTRGTLKPAEGFEEAIAALERAVGVTTSAERPASSHVQGTRSRVQGTRTTV